MAAAAWASVGPEPPVVQEAPELYTLEVSDCEYVHDMTEGGYTYEVWRCGPAPPFTWVFDPGVGRQEL